MTALPNMSAYLARLPHGLESFPEAQAKASLYRATLDRSAVPDLSILPKPLADLVERPAPVSSWVPEVHSHALIMASRDLRFDSDRAFLEFSYDSQKALFSGRLYRIMLSVASPSLLLRTGALRWGTFHRGSSFTVEEATANGASIRVDYPAGMWQGLIGDALVAGLQAVLDLSGAIDARLTIADHTPQLLRIRGTWFT